VPTREVPEKFLVAFSFAGEQRELVRSIAEAVEERLGRGSVFLDEWFEYYVAGSDADTLLQEIYGQRAELVIVSVSANYGGKPWTLAEHRAIRARQMQLEGSKDKKDAFRILPLRTGEGDVKGILFNTISPDVRLRPVAQTAELIVNRLRLIMPDAKPTAAAPSRFVYLATCTPDMDDQRDRMKVFLEERGWTVLPAGEYPEDEYQSALEKNLKESRAFVQLLGPYPWKPVGFDRIQNETAFARGIPRFRYRSSEIDLSKVDAKQREFLSAPEIIATGFEDFKAHLEKELAVLAQRRNATADEDGDEDTPPHVLVAIRSANPDPLWDQVYAWIYDQEKIDPSQLMPDESLEAKHRAEPCHGFLVVCDAGSLEEGPYSPREYMEQWRQIQMQEKNAARRPPVALVYWPPPPAIWSRLLRTTPLKLHRIVGDTPTNLDEFFDEVRKVAQ
jgi:hypothetical protein